MLGLTMAKGLGLEPEDIIVLPVESLNQDWSEDDVRNMADGALNVALERVQAPQ